MHNSESHAITDEALDVEWQWVVEWLPPEPGDTVALKRSVLTGHATRSRGVEIKGVNSDISTKTERDSIESNALAVVETEEDKSPIPGIPILLIALLVGVLVWLKLFK